MRKVIRILIFLIIFISGFSMLVYPNIQQVLGQHEMDVQIEEFKTTDNNYSTLYYQMEEYNQRIYVENQTGLKDAWSYQENEFDFSEINTDKDMIGYISIAAMNIELPLYVGATRENMNKGATVLGQTSMPIGGMNTNCVIAAHRGTYTSAMFRDIENLTIGDVIRITNPWETLEYEVVKCIAISPDDIEAVKILPGSDMITLMSCHPYPYNYQRYVVFAQRKNTQKIEIPYAGENYESSQDKLKFDKLINMVGVSFFVVVVILILIIVVVKKIRDQKN